MQFQNSTLSIQHLVPHVLQEPLGGNLPPDTLFFRALVNSAGAGGELEPLRAGVDEKRRLFRTRAAGDFARLEIHEVFEIVAAIVVDRRIRNLRALLRLAGDVAGVAVEPHHALVQSFKRVAPELDGNVAALHHARADLARAHARDVRAVFEPVRLVEDDARRIGAGGDDVRAAHDRLRAVDGFHADVELPGHLARVGLAVGLRRAVNLYFRYLPYLVESLQIRSRHAAGTEDADDARLGARQVLRAEPGACADAHVLEHAVVDDRERLAVAHAEDHDEAAVCAGLHAIFFFGHAVGPVDDVGLHADREDADLAARALHRAPAVVAVGALRRHPDIHARTVDRVAFQKIVVAGLQRFEAAFHVEQLLDILVVDQQHGSSRLLSTGARKKMQGDLTLNRAQ